MTDLDAVEIRAYRPGDEQAILAGFHAAFGVLRTLEEWRWSFPPLEGTPTVEVATDAAGRLVAHYAAIPVALRQAGRQILAGQVVDVFTRRKLGLFRRRGLLTRTIESFLRRWCGPGRLELLYGFPSLRAAALGRATDVYPAEAGVLRWTAPAARRHAPLGWRRSIERGWNRASLERLWSAAADRYPLAVVRDADWFRHRFLERPRRDYLQLGVRRGGAARAWGVLALGGERARWADLLWDGQQSGDLALLAGEVRRLAARAGAREVELWLSGDPAAGEVLADQGWASAPHPDLRLVARSFTPALGDREAVERLYVTLADSDLV